VFFGEVGLAGEVRAVGQTEARVKEAAKLGFEQVFLPPGGSQGGRRSPTQDGLRVQEIRRLGELPELLGCDGRALSAGARQPIARAGAG
jgi:DNA repair protein RadA/Sms